MADGGIEDTKVALALGIALVMKLFQKSGEAAAASSQQVTQPGQHEHHSPPAGLVHPWSATEYIVRGCYQVIMALRSRAGVQ